MKKDTVITFLTINNFNDLLTYYNTSNKQLQEMMENIYRVAYRYALTKSQVKYLLEEAIRPFDNDLEMMEDLI